VKHFRNPKRDKHEAFQTDHRGGTADDNQGEPMTNVKGKGRGDQIRLLVRLYRILDLQDGLTVNDIVKPTGMSTRQVYRWLNALNKKRKWCACQGTDLPGGG